MLGEISYNSAPLNSGKNHSSDSVLSFLGTEKFLRVLFLFSASLHLIDFPIFLYAFYLLLGACGIILPLQKPWTRKSDEKTYPLLSAYSIIYFFNILFWLGSIKYYGPIRTILTTELADAALVTFFSKFKISESLSSSNKQKIYGLFFLSFAWLLMFIFGPSIDYEKQHLKGNSEPEFFIKENPQVFLWFGLSFSQNFWGTICVFFTLISSFFMKSISKKLFSQEKNFGGPRRLFAITTPMVLALLFPVAFVQYLYAQSGQGLTILFSPIFWLTTIFTIVGEFYIHNLIPASIDLDDIAKVSLISSFLGCFFAPFYWIGIDRMSLTTFICFIFIFYGMHLIFKSSKSKFSLPLYPEFDVAMRGIQIFSLTFLKSSLKQILSHRDSQRIFIFLVLNLMFMFVEMIYGIWTNSLGLISDACHMLFDCTALVIGLFASIISNWEKNSTFSYGYGRFETLSGFINGIFLVFVAIMVLMESTERIYSPVNINTDKLLLVSVLGLLVNLVGVVAFHDLHAHEEDDDNSHGHSHGHSHNHSHIHGGASDSNVYGVYLHVIADTLGSVGVIISSLLIEYFGWTLADPICSFCISLMIFLSVIPLLKNSAYNLLQATPQNLYNDLEKHLVKVLNIQGVVTYSNPHFWKYSKNYIVGTLNVHIDNMASEQKVLKEVRQIFVGAGVKNFTCQVKKS